MANFANTKWCKKTWKITETLAHGYSSESTTQLSNEHQHDRVWIVFKNRCALKLVLWMKVAWALEGLITVKTTITSLCLSHRECYWHIFFLYMFFIINVWWVCGLYFLCCDGEQVHYGNGIFRKQLCAYTVSVLKSILGWMDTSPSTFFTIERGAAVQYVPQLTTYTRDLAGSFTDPPYRAPRSRTLLVVVDLTSTGK